jgi:hypothetical protein
MRLLAPAVLSLALVAVGGVLAGCGGNNAPAASATQSVSAPITKAQAAAYAHAVNLRASDLPDMDVSKPEHEEKAPTHTGLQLARCAGELDPLPRVLARSSPRFTSPVEEGEEEQAKEVISSSVEVLPTPAVAAEHNAAQISPRGLNCIRRYIPASLAKGNTRRLHYGPVTIHRLHNPLPGVAGSFAVEITTSVIGVPSQIAATPPHVYIDVLGFISGACEINLDAVGFPQPVPEEAEQRLMSVLYSRAETNKLH